MPHSQEKSAPIKIGPQLRAAIGPEATAALERTVSDHVARAYEDGLAAGLAQQAAQQRGDLPQAYVGQVMRGISRSWSMWTGAALLALPEILPLLDRELPALLGPQAAERVMQACGILMLALRVKTTASLADKGRRP